MNDPVSTPVVFVPARNHFRRDLLLGTADKVYAGGIKLFSGLDPVTLRRLVDEGFVDRDRSIAGRPTVASILRFAARWPVVRCDGHVIGPRRPDYGIVIDVLIVRGRLEPAVHARLEHEFTMFVRGADEVNVSRDELRAWWGR